SRLRSRSSRSCGSRSSGRDTPSPTRCSWHSRSRCSSTTPPAPFSRWAGRRFSSCAAGSERLSTDHPDRPVRLRAMRRTPVAAALAAAAVALVAVGCESPEEASPAPSTVEGELTTPQEECTVPACDLKGDPAKGKQIFAEKGCGGCHTLADAGSNGTVGPTPRDAKPPFDLGGP